ncbi:hypothetical protein M8C21_023687 [Ambrosia artemisiifolia]|uniref:Ubiquitin-like protease family profile domain-containing protein n=1 Tax=Ambrosia artemisiifolia TaxID=4212 RepID=A0AAD5C7B5_AMBAR|nr:hypothetical protein M8C21_023687 [Ambrosia artemisiifolia]
MGALTCNRFKRDSESQSSPSFAFDYTHPHVSKKLKSSDSCSSSVSRLRLYPKLVTPIVREIQAPCIVVKGFSAKRLDSSCSGNFSGYSRVKFDNCGDRMGSLFSKYCRAKESAKGTCRYVSFEPENEVVEVIDVDGENENGNDGSGDSGVEEVAVVETEREGVNELQNIRAKYRELDGKAEGKVGFQPSTSSGVDSDVLDGNALESLSLDPRLDVLVDVGLPYHKKLIESAQKRDERLRRLSFDIKLQEEKRALYKQLTPVKKDESKKDEELLLEPFRPLTEDDEEMVAVALSNSSRRKLLVTHDNSNIAITGEVLRCLRPGAWLNDEVINLYLELLKEREKKEPKKFLKCHFFNTFFYKKLISGRTGYDYKSVRRWTTQRKLGYSLLECDKIFVPVHKEIHWCLAVINKKEEKFQYLDSLGGVDKQVMRVLAKYFVDEVKDKNGEDIDVTSWQQEYVTDLPNQENGFDCGVFMIKYADFYSRDIGLCFKQEHMPYFRLRTAKEILRLRAD